MTRDRLLGQARADLVALPDLVDQLPDPTQKHHDLSHYHPHKIVGSPALINLQVIHLTDTRHKPGFDLEDPRHTNLTSWLGILPILEQWTRVLCDELGPERPELTEHATIRSECAVLVEHWPWITQQRWALKLAKSIRTTTDQVNTQLGIRPEPTYACAQCGNPAYLQPGGILACTEQPDHDLVVRDLEAQMRRRPALPTKEICEEFGIEPGTLRVWKFRRKIRPAPNKISNDVHHWFPWDVFCLLNPDIAEAFAAKDELRDDPAETIA